ncbi:MAG: SDR family oxidoreductase, partial [Pseudomonadota bacterium]
EMADAVTAAGGATTLVPLDLTDEGGVQRMCLALHQRWGRLDLWLHAAIHAAPLSPADHISAKDFDRAVEVNVRTAQRLIFAVSPLLRVTPGARAVYLTDARAGAKFFGTYGATKGAQTALFDSWAAETAATGPTVTGFEPRPMPTALRARFYPGEDPATLSPPAVEAERLIAELNCR